MSGELNTGKTCPNTLAMVERCLEDALGMVDLALVLALGDLSAPTRVGVAALGLVNSKAAATGVSDRLERKGYVTRTHDALDRRAVLLELTEKGREIYRLACERPRTPARGAVMRKGALV